MFTVSTSSDRASHPRGPVFFALDSLWERDGSLLQPLEQRPAHQL